MSNKDREIELCELEKLESKYLKKYYHFLKYCLDEILIGFDTKNKIKDDWINQWNKDLKKGESKGISDFADGAERIIYSLLNGKGIGQPNSAPIGADLFFEVENAFIHIDVKTVQIKNIKDYINNINVGNNQNSYNSKNIKRNGKTIIYDEAALPTYYKVKYNDGRKINKKPCLTYFITILYEAENLDILNINILSMPNGELEEIYKGKILGAGKLQYPKGDKKRDGYYRTIRYLWPKCKKFTLYDSSSRYKVIYYNEKLVEKLYKQNKIDESSKKKLNKLLNKKEESK